MDLYQFKVMPFGLGGAPATLQRMMDQVLRGTEEAVGVYIDDVIIYSHTWSDHLRHLKNVLERLQSTGLTLKLKKCTIAASEYTYLGHEVGHGSVQPEQAKVLAIQHITPPRRKKDVRAFLGITGYYHRCISKFMPSLHNH